jgi:hypothetical protein
LGKEATTIMEGTTEDMGMVVMEVTEVATKKFHEVKLHLICDVNSNDFK